MSTVLHADGTQLEDGEYMKSQAMLMTRFTQAALEAGPEHGSLSEQDKIDLESITHHAFEDRERWKRVHENPYVSYLQEVWRHTFAVDVGCLARVDGEHIESVWNRIENFQEAVAENVGNLRHYWHKQTGQILSLQTAWSHIRWDGPRVREYSDGEDLPQELFYEHTALFPYVIQENGVAELVFGNGAIHPKQLSVPVRYEVRELLEKEIEKYKKIM